MDEHQRRVWSRMIEAIDAHAAGEIDLGKLASDLEGLLSAADLHDQTLINEFWDHFVEIDSELELRTESWAPPGAASDDRLRDALSAYRRWAQNLLDTNGTERR